MSKTIGTPTSEMKRILTNRPKEIYMTFGKPTTLKDISSKQCRFPIEGTEFYCGAITEGKIYCSEHCKICYWKPKD